MKLLILSGIVPFQIFGRSNDRNPEPTHPRKGRKAITHDGAKVMNGHEIPANRNGIGTSSLTESAVSWSAH
jgi:hypothetical protein